MTDTADATGHIGADRARGPHPRRSSDPDLNVLPRDRVVAALQRMERPVDAVVDEATGLDLCRRET